MFACVNVCTESFAFATARSTAKIALSKIYTLFMITAITYYFVKLLIYFLNCKLVLIGF